MPSDAPVTTAHGRQFVVSGGTLYVVTNGAGSYLDTKTTYAYRDKILGAGGTQDAAVLVKDFLGRDFNFKAFEDYLLN